MFFIRNSRSFWMDVMFAYKLSIQNTERSNYYVRRSRITLHRHRWKMLKWNPNKSLQYRKKWNARRLTSHLALQTISLFVYLLLAHFIPYLCRSIFFFECLPYVKYGIVYFIVNQVENMNELMIVFVMRKIAFFLFSPYVRLFLNNHKSNNFSVTLKKH